jgi:hypothetical protein
LNFFSGIMGIPIEPTVRDQDASSASSKNAKLAMEPTKSQGMMTDTENGEAHEIFKLETDGVHFRTVSWQRATVVFLKINFAMSILAIPGALAALGSVGGSLALIGFTALNVCELTTTQPP